MDRNLKSIFGVFLSISLSGCFLGDGFFAQSGALNSEAALGLVDAEVLSEADGAKTGKFLTASNGTQIMNASSGSGIDGASIQAPPGSLAVDTNITMEEGLGIADGVILGNLGLAAAVEGSSAAVVVASSAAIDASSPLTLAVNLPSGAGLVDDLEMKNLVIFYQVIRQDSGGKIFEGVIPRKQLKIVDGKVSFEIKYFGLYQAAILNSVFNQASEVKSERAIKTKREQKAEEVAAEDPVENSVVDDPEDDPEEIISTVALGEVTSASTYSNSSRNVGITWGPGPNDTNIYRVAYERELPGESKTFPTTCDSGTIVTDRKFELNDLVAQTKIYFKICMTDAEGTASSLGVDRQVSSTASAFTSAQCGGGTNSLDTTCNINTTVSVPAGMIIAGMGDLNITSVSGLTTPGQELIIEMDGTVSIDSTCGINMDGKGYLGGSGNGPMDGAGPLQSRGKGGPNPTGGAHGGEGGYDAGSFTYQTTSKPFGRYADPFHDQAHFPAGAGGGSGSNTSPVDMGGSGGGVVNIFANVLNLNTAAAICANGSDGMNNGGGGAGGTINIDVVTLQATASPHHLKVHGGNGNGTGAGGGSGGRIVVKANSIDSDLTYALYGGMGANATSGGSSGTYFSELRSGAGPVYELHTLGDSTNGAPITSVAATYIDVNLQPLDLLSIGQFSRVFFSSMHNPVNAPIQNFEMGFSSSINHDGRGHPSGIGSVMTVGGGTSFSSAGGGGGHGAAGATVVLFASGGSPHGDSINPTSLGGAGAGDGSLPGGAGGGRVYLEIDGPCTMMSGATISANGSHGVIGGNGGGGAGGSIRLKCHGTFSGSGAVLSVQGGNGAGSGGGGAGGRIWFEYPTATAPTYNVSGGTGNVSGSGTFMDQPL